MANEKVNKVVLGNETLIDLTGDTVTANSLLAGATAHDNRGEQIQGAVSVPTELNDLNDVNITSPQEGDVLVSDENGVYQNQPKSLYPSAPTLSWADYQQLVDDDEDDPDAEYYIDDIDVSEAYYVETSGQTALTGATSLTFTNSHITPTSDIRILAEPASCKVSTNPQYKVSAKLSSVGSGTATITFPALAENTEFWLLIECPLAITQNDETKADKIDLTSINVVGSTNTTGSAISAGTYFYLNGLLVRAKTNIATNATFTLNTNYEVVTAGALNELKDTPDTTERVVGTYCGETWYEKVIDFGQIPSGVNDGNHLGPYLTGVKKVMLMEAHTLSSSGLLFSLPYITLNDIAYSISAMLFIDNNSTDLYLRLYTKTDRTSFGHIWGTVRYVKA